MSKISIRFYNDHEVRAVWDKSIITCTSQILLSDD